VQGGGNQKEGREKQEKEVKRKSGRPEESIGGEGEERQEKRGRRGGEKPEVSKGAVEPTSQKADHLL